MHGLWIRVDSFLISLHYFQLAVMFIRSHMNTVLMSVPVCDRTEIIRYLVIYLFRMKHKETILLFFPQKIFILAILIRIGDEGNTLLLDREFQKILNMF